MYFNRFDIVIAHLLFSESYHDGMYSDLYKKSCRIRKYFCQGNLDLEEEVSENQNALEIYRNLVYKHFPELYDNDNLCNV